MAGICNGRAGTGSVTHSLADRGDDFYATPLEAVNSLLAIEKGSIPVAPIWEPACGDGAITIPFRKAGYTVVAQDLISRGCPDSTHGHNFLLSSTSPVGAKSIITNPPFKDAKEFVEHSLAFDGVKYVAMLLRLAFLEGSKRKSFFESSPLARVHIASRRLPMMHRGGWDGPKSGSAVCFAWFVWEKSHIGRPEIRWFDHKYLQPANDNTAVTQAAA